MSLAVQLQDYLDSQAARATARQADRLSRDAFIQAQFPVLNARLLELLTDAVGQHSRLAIATTPVVENVIGRSFTTLNETAVRVTATLEGAAQTVAFTPRLEFRGSDQFGAVDCTVDFAFAPRRSRRDAIAASLLAYGVQMIGTTSAHLMLTTAQGPVEAGVSAFESALVALLLRG
jgi:hypothetical protein